jgi:hypothetical protein
VAGRARRSAVRTAAAAALSCLVLVGCAEKSDSQRATDAVKEEIAKRAKPLSILCGRPAGRPDPALWNTWTCMATLRDTRTPYAACVVLLASPDPPSCEFSRRPVKRSERLVIR